MSSPPRRQSSLKLQWDSPSSLKMVRPVCSTAGDDSEVHVFELNDLFEETSSLRELWQSKLLCDVVLKSFDGACVHAHKIVLASVSPFFRALFTGAGQSMKELSETLSTGENLVDLKGVQGSALEQILEAIYSRQLEVSPGNLEMLLSCSNLLEIPPIQEACYQYLRRCLGLHNCLDILELTDRYNCIDLQNEVLRFVCGKFSELLSSPDWQKAFGRLSKSTIIDILRSDDIDVDSERQVLDVGLAWVGASPQIRHIDVPDILSAVRLSHQIVLQELRNHNLMPEIDGGWMSPDSPIMARCTVDEFSTRAAAPRKRTATGLMVTGGHDADWRSLKMVEVYNPYRDEWSPGPAMPSSFSFTGAAAVGSDVVVIGGTMYSANVCRFDGRTRSWVGCPPLNTARVHSAITSMAGVLYVLGGRTGVGQPLCSVETLEYRGCGDPVEWREGAQLCQPRSALGAGAFGSRVYAVGGQAGRTIYDTVECLDVGRGQWELVSSRLNMERKYVAVGVVGGRLFAVGGMNEQRIRLSSVEAYDPREGIWRSVGSMHVARSSCGVATLHERLYVVGGNAGDDLIHDTVECFLPETNQWVPCASVSCARSGLSVVPI
ncbi:hypothetical protein BSKO_12970 [Bryopsis sp. KO-2023]|nr:hypothetical protein BSKO_12970 [Bryopsis sp. KO-2023]